MPFLSKMLQNYENNPSQYSREDVVSIFTFMVQQPSENISNFEQATKLMFHVVKTIFRNNFYENVQKILISLQTVDYITINVEFSCKIFIRDKAFFATIFLCCLKFDKEIFRLNEAVKFLQMILEHLLSLICIDKPQGLHLLRLMELILKKREDILSSQTSMIILITMCKVSSSPLIGFKHLAHSISRIAIKSQSRSSQLFNYHNFPVKGIDLGTVLKFIDRNYIRDNAQSMNNHILRMFHNNTDSREASFYYEALINVFSLDEFVEFLWPEYCENVEFFEEEGEFCQSLIKYWIPINIKRYKKEFYEFIRHTNANYCLKVHILIEAKKQGHYDKNNFDSDALTFVKYAKTSTLGLRIFSIFPKKNSRLDLFDIAAVEYFLKNYSKSEFSPFVLKILTQFFSQIFLMGHIINPLAICSKFLLWVYNFCLFQIKSENFEIGAQLLRVVWNTSAGSHLNLITAYKIDKENFYENQGNLYYRHLIDCKFWEKTFMSPELINILGQSITNRNCYCPSLIQLVAEYYLPAVVFPPTTFPELIRSFNNSISLNSSLKVRIFSDLLARKKENFDNETDELFQMFNEKIYTSNIENLFTCVLILDAFISLKKHFDLDLTDLIEKSLDSFNVKFEENVQEKLCCKAVKVLEALISNTLECLMESKNHWSKLHKEKVLNHLCEMIQKSNMKKPVCLSIHAVHNFGASMDEVNLKLLNATLSSLYEAPSKLYIKMRRNPETRLVIHALSRNARPLLKWSLSFLLETLCDTEASDSTISAAINCLEVLVSDNSIHQITLPYIPEITMHCIQFFNRNSWRIRNSDLQLVKALIERFLGVQLSHNLRPKSVEDLFVLFPDLADQFYETLSRQQLDDRAIIALLFFSESQIKNNILLDESVRNTLEKFQYIFVDIIKKYSNNFGTLAIQSFCSLCPDYKIPTVYHEVVSFVQCNFFKLEKNIFANFIQLLRGLYNKFRWARDKSGLEIINSSTISFVKYFTQFSHYFYFNLLSIKLQVDEIVNKLENEIDFQSRILLYNNLPFVFREIRVDQLSDFLKKILFLNPSEFLQIEILSILANRFCKNSVILHEILEVLILKLSELKDCSKMLIASYAKTILLFFETLSDLEILSSDVVNAVRRDFQAIYIYKILIYVVVLGHVDKRTKDDDLFLKKCIKIYIREILVDDDEVLEDISVTIKYLYKSCSSVEVLNLAVHLLIKESTSFEICKFVSFLTKKQCSTVVNSVDVFFDITNLTNCLGSEKSAVEFLVKIFQYLDELPDSLGPSDTYYLIENDFSVPKQYVRCVIRKSLICYSKMFL